MHKLPLHSPLAFSSLCFLLPFSFCSLLCLRHGFARGDGASIDREAAPTRALGYSHVTPEVLEGMILNGLVDRSQVRAPPNDQASARPEPGEVVVFRNFFTAGLRFLLDPVIVDIFRLFTVYLHQMTPTSFVRLNLFMWLAKTGRVEPTAEAFARVFRIHYQPKTIVVTKKDGSSGDGEPQYGSYTFAFRKTTPSPIQAYRNKWPAEWTNSWFYHKIRLDPETNSSPLWVAKIPLLSKTQVVVPPDTAVANTFVALLRVVVKSFSTWDLIEQFSACQCFAIREWWSVSSWAPDEKWIEGISMPDFTKCFGLRREGVFFLSVVFAFDCKH